MSCLAKLTRHAALATAAVLVGATACAAQGVPPFRVSPTTAEPGVEVAVTYQFLVEGATDTMEAQAELADRGRRALYSMMARECEVLLATIAQACAVRRASVNTQLQKSRSGDSGVRVSGSASYEITLKPQRPAQ